MTSLWNNQEGTQWKEIKEDKVYKLQRVWYGLKKYPTAWFSRREESLIKEKVEKSQNVEKLLLKNNEDGASAPWSSKSKKQLIVTFSTT